jgi:hypothetical protein
MKEEQTRTIAISESGNYSFYRYFIAGYYNPGMLMGKTKGSCSGYANEPCYIFAIGNEITSEGMRRLSPAQ